MLKFKNQRTATIGFLITAIETKKHTLLPCCIHAKRHDLILIQKLIES